MKVTLGTNIAALRTLRHLDGATGELNGVFERLSTGQRITGAAHDPAGLAIAASLEVNGRVAQQGVRNLNDGLSVINIASSAIENLSTIVVRLAELSEQAANGTLGHHQRASLDEEAQALTKEYSRIIRSTEYNGVKLLSGQLDTLSLQAGRNALAMGTGGAMVASGEFHAPVKYGVPGTAFSVTVGDFDGDGVPDLVSTDTTNSRVHVLLGNGDGSFQPGASATVGSFPRSVSSGDFNGDGALDLVTANYSDHTVSVLLGNGDGSFAAETTIATGNSPFWTSVADLDGDGIQDIVTADWASNSVSVLIGNADGTFQPRTPFAVGGSPVSVNIGDFNGDGIPDLVTGQMTGNNVSILLGNGDGTSRLRRSSMRATGHTR